MEFAERRASTLQILDIPPVVMEEFCRCMDCLSEWEWMRFASQVISDTMTLRRIHLLRRTGVSITRELMWSWGQRKPTMKDLMKLLQDLELYRAVDILLQPGASTSANKAAETSAGGAATTCGTNANGGELKIQSSCSSEMPASLPPPPPPPEALLHSLQIDSSVDDVDSSIQEILSAPRQESSLVAGSSCKLWTSEEVEEATRGFSSSNKIHTGEFADVFIGRTAGNIYAIKCLKQRECEQDSVRSYFHTEAQIRFRCSHSKLLPLLGFCVESRPRCLINKFMENGSLDIALEKSGEDLLSWEKRLTVAAGLVQAVCYLHDAGICHGNIKSCNVFLDEDSSPKLGHSGLRFHPGRGTSYTQAKTKNLQKFACYLPYSFLRDGHLTRQTDMFSCGVVLAEIMSGLKPCDQSRRPACLKDLFIEEIEAVMGQTEPEKMQTSEETPETLSARYISQKYTDTRGGRPMGTAAFYFASAICLCLTKKKTMASEVYATMKKAENLFREEKKLDIGPQESKKKSVLSLNVPQEIDDSEILPLACTEGVALKLPINSSKPPGVTEQYNQTSKKDSNKTQCDASGSASLPLEVEDLYQSPEESTHHRTNRYNRTHRYNPSTPEDPTYSSAKDTETTRKSKDPCEPPDSSDSSTGSSFPSWGITMNAEKKKLLENIALYEEERLGSSDLFDCS